jgi:hypothetical protein
MLLLRHPLGVDNHDTVVAQFGAQIAPPRLLVAREHRNHFGNPHQLFGRRQSVRRPVRDTLANLALQRGHTHHEEFVEVVCGDRQEPQLLEQRMIGVGGLVQNPLIEMQPG